MGNGPFEEDLESYCLKGQLTSRQREDQCEAWRPEGTAHQVTAGNMEPRDGGRELSWRQGLMRPGTLDPKCKGKWLRGFKGDCGVPGQQPYRG